MHKAQQGVRKGAGSWHSCVRSGGALTTLWPERYAAELGLVLLCWPLNELKGHLGVIWHSKGACSGGQPAAAFFSSQTLCTSAYRSTCPQSQKRRRAKWKTPIAMTNQTAPRSTRLRPWGQLQWLGGPRWLCHLRRHEPSHHQVGAFASGCVLVLGKTQLLLITVEP